MTAIHVPWVNSNIHLAFACCLLNTRSRSASRREVEKVQFFAVSWGEKERKTSERGKAYERVTKKLKVRYGNFCTGC